MVVEGDEGGGQGGGAVIAVEGDGEGCCVGSGEVGRCLAVGGWGGGRRGGECGGIVSHGAIRGGRGLRRYRGVAGVWYGGSRERRSHVGVIVVERKGNAGAATCCKIWSFEESVHAV